MAMGGWRRGALTSSAHRLCFFWAAVQWAASAWWWTCALSGAVPVTRAPAAVLHGLWFGLGAMPLFIVGFLLTAGPKWLRTPAVDARKLRHGVAAFNLGWLAVPLGAAWDARLAAAGLMLAAAGLAALGFELAGVIRRSSRADKTHPLVMAVGLGAMVACLAVAGAVLAGGRTDWLSAIARAGLWWGPVTVFVVASHRMVPLLADGLWPWLDARWPNWSLWWLTSVPAVQGVVALQTLAGPPHTVLRVLEATHLALVCASSAALTLRWLGAPPLRSALMRMLFVALLWWTAGLGLLGAAAWPGWPEALTARTGMAGLHALVVGHLGGTMLTVVTRFSAAQTGRSRAIDRVVIGLYALLQGAVVGRVTAALWPMSSGIALTAASLAWAAVALGWLMRYGPWLAAPSAPKPTAGDDATTAP